jgi:hypothetical protein
MAGGFVAGTAVAIEGCMRRNQTVVKSPANDEHESAIRGLSIINRGDFDVANHGE